MMWALPWAATKALKQLSVSTLATKRRTAMEWVAAKLSVPVTQKAQLSVDKG